jgi:hypothetical protein
MIYPEFPECKTECGIAQTEDAIASWVEEMINIAIEHPDLKSRVARGILEEISSLM